MQLYRRTKTPRPFRAGLFITFRFVPFKRAISASFSATTPCHFSRSSPLAWRRAAASLWRAIDLMRSISRNSGATVIVCEEYIPKILLRKGTAEALRGYVLRVKFLTKTTVPVRSAAGLVDFGYCRNSVRFMRGGRVLLYPCKAVLSCHFGSSRNGKSLVYGKCLGFWLRQKPKQHPFCMGKMDVASPLFTASRHSPR